MDQYQIESDRYPYIRRMAKKFRLIWGILQERKRFRSFQIGFRSLAADCAKILPI